MAILDTINTAIKPTTSASSILNGAGYNFNSDRNVVPQIQTDPNAPKPSQFSTTPAGNIQNPFAASPQTPQTDPNFTNLVNFLQTNPNTNTTTEPQFSIPTTSSTSAAFSTNKNYQDILAKRQQYEDQYAAALQNYAETSAAEKSGKITDLGRQYNALYSGDTTDYGQGLAGMVGIQNTIKQGVRTANTEAALLAAQGAGKLLDINQKDIENVLATAPESKQFNINPATGDVYAQIIDPTTGEGKTVNIGSIGAQKQYVSSSINQDPMSGQLIFTGVKQDGTVDTQSLSSMLAQTGNQGVNDQNIPYLVETYTQRLSDGTPYINMSKVAQTQQSAVKLLAAQAGVPTLEDEDVVKARSIDVTSQNLAQMGLVAEKILSAGLAGRLQGLTQNQLENIAQTNPEISSFQTYRDAAINAIQALAGGSGSGFRLNQSEIEVASSNLPTITDNIETARMKLSIVQSFLGKWKNQLLPNQHTQTTPSNLQPTSSGGVTGNPTQGWF